MSLVLSGASSLGSVVDHLVTAWGSRWCFRMACRGHVSPTIAAYPVNFLAASVTAYLAPSIAVCAGMSEVFGFVR